MREMVPIPFLAPKHSLAVAILSYDGGVRIGLIGDYDAIPDLDDLGEAMAGSSPRSPRPRWIALRSRLPPCRRSSTSTA